MLQSQTGVYSVVLFPSIFCFCRSPPKSTAALQAGVGRGRAALKGQSPPAMKPHRRVQVTLELCQARLSASPGFLSFGGFTPSFPPGGGFALGRGCSLGGIPAKLSHWRFDRRRPGLFSDTSGSNVPSFPFYFPSSERGWSQSQAQVPKPRLPSPELVAPSHQLHPSHAAAPALRRDLASAVVGDWKDDAAVCDSWGRRGRGAVGPAVGQRVTGGSSPSLLARPQVSRRWLVPVGAAVLVPAACSP